ncbi:unnamed protein product, partial [Closterium sp. NIES-54]
HHARPPPPARAAAAPPRSCPPRHTHTRAPLACQAHGSQQPAPQCSPLQSRAPGNPALCGRQRRATWAAWQPLWAAQWRWWGWRRCWWGCSVEWSRREQGRTTGLLLRLRCHARRAKEAASAASARARASCPKLQAQGSPPVGWPPTPPPPNAPPP